MHEELLKIGEDHVFNARAYVCAQSITVIEDTVYHHDNQTVSLCRPESMKTRVYLDEAKSLALRSRILAPVIMAQLVHYLRQHPYRCKQMKAAVDHLDEAEAKRVLSVYTPIYEVMPPERAYQALLHHHDMIPKIKKTGALYRLAEWLHDRDVDRVYRHFKAQPASGSARSITRNGRTRTSRTSETTTILGTRN